MPPKKKKRAKPTKARKAVDLTLKLNVEVVPVDREHLALSVAAWAHA